MSGAGGLSGAGLWQVETHAGLCCLRCWPAEHPKPERLQFIHAAQQFAAENGFDRTLLALPLSTAKGTTFFQHERRLWQLEPWLPGHACPAAAVTPAIIRLALLTLAQLHQALARWPATVGRRQPPPGLRSRQTALRALDAGDCGVLVGAVQQSQDPLVRESVAPLAARLRQAVALVLPLVDAVADQARPIAPSLRDIHREHVLFAAGRVSGIVDWGAARVDLQLTDLARLLGSLAGDQAAEWEVGLEAYFGHCPVPADERRVLRALDASGVVLGAANWMRWLCLEGRPFPDPPAVRTRLEVLLARLTTLLDR